MPDSQKRRASISDCVQVRQGGGGRSPQVEGRQNHVEERGWHLGEMKVGECDPCEEWGGSISGVKVGDPVKMGHAEADDASLRIST